MPFPVLHILGSAAVDGTGIARIVSGLSRELDRDRFKLHACFLCGDGALTKYLLENGVDARAVRLHENLLGPLRFVRLLREIKPAIVHQHSGGPRLTRLVRWASGAKIVVHVHGTIDEANMRHPEAINHRGADALIANSEAVARLVSGARAHLIHAGVETGYAFASGHPGQGLVIGTAGRLTEVKGHVYLIQAFARLINDFPNIRLEICGEGPNRAALEAEARRMNCADAISFLGWRNDYPTLALGWDMFVLPSIEESFGIALLEAMSTGLPSIASKVGGIPELLVDGVTGWLVPPRDVSALASRMRQLLNDQEGRLRMGHMARHRARDQFSLQRMAKKVEAVYDSVLR